MIKRHFCSLILICSRKEAFVEPSKGSEGFLMFIEFESFAGDEGNDARAPTQTSLTNAPQGKISFKNFLLFFYS